MYAIFKTGGKQYKVVNGQMLYVEKLEAEAGSKIDFKDVMLVGNEDDSQKLAIGNPFVSNATVSATVLAQELDDKIIVFKKKRRTNYRRKQGHRQRLTKIKIENISQK